MKALVYLFAVTLAALSARAVPATVTAYVVKADQLDAAGRMTTAEIQSQLPALWSEKFELTVNSPSVVTKTIGTRTINLQILAKPIPRTIALEINLQLEESVEADQKETKLRSLSTNVSMLPGTAQKIVMTTSKNSAATEEGGVVEQSEGMYYVLSLEAEPPPSK